MLIARQKRKENIAEYLLYMYQVEDLIRAFRLDIDLIENQLVSKYQVDEKTRKEILDWYTNLVIMMKKEGASETGHLQFISNLVFDLNEIHLKLMDSETDKMYVQTFQAVAGLLTELKHKNKLAKNDIQISLDAIYGYLLLKMQKKEVSAETSEAVKRLSSWLSAVAKLFKQHEKGDLVFE